MRPGPTPFDLGALSCRIEQQRAERGLSMAALAREVGVSASTIRRFKTAADAEADGVLALISWLGDPPERFVDGGVEATGTTLPPARNGCVRVDMRRVTTNESGGRIHTRTTIQRLTIAAQDLGCSIASLTRWSEV